MRSALRRRPDMSRKRDGIVVTADPNRISAAQMDIWRGSAKRKLFPAGVGNVAEESFMGPNFFRMVYILSLVFIPINVIGL
jgi:hypothetical protein